MRTVTRSILLTVAALLLSSAAALATDEALPAEQVIAAIQAAVAAQPGLVKEVEVDREGGRLIVKVDILTNKGQEVEVRIDPERNERIR